MTLYTEENEITRNELTQVQIIKQVLKAFTAPYYFYKHQKLIY